MWRRKASAAPLLLPRRAGYSAPSASDSASDAVTGDLLREREADSASSLACRTPVDGDVQT